MSKMEVYEVDGITVTRASDNIFADLGLPNADEVLLKSDLVLAIERIIQDRDWSNDEAACAMQATPEAVYTLRVGDFDELSFDQLLKMLKALGLKVSVVVEPEPADEAQAKPESAVASYAAT